MTKYALILHLNGHSFYGELGEVDQVKAILAVQNWFKENPESSLKDYRLELVRLGEVTDLSPLYKD